MTFWKDKQGNELTFKEFMSRWKKGIEGITPLQQAKGQIWGTNIMLVGLIAGIVVSIIAWENLWWVLIILLGALINTFIQWMGTYQKIIILTRVEEQMKGGLSLNE